jgi:hypothetical protein
MTISQLGPHRVRHGDLMDPGGVEDLMGADRASLFYSDPPWGQGNLTYWQTMNTKMNGVDPKSIDYGDFLDRVLTLAKTFCDGYVVIEYGIRWRDDLMERAARAGLSHCGVVQAQYKSGSKLLPLDIHLLSVHAAVAPAGYFDGVRDTYGKDCVQRALLPLAVPGGIIMDPACGLGYTAKVGIEAGMTFRGNEINETRLAKTIAAIEKQSPSA